jgi:uncharacterized protein
MLRLLTAFGLVMALMAPARAASALADPAPTIEHPRRIVMSLSERDPARIETVLNNIGNLQRFYGADYVRIALVAYGPGLDALLKDLSGVKDRIQSLVAIDVEVEACGNTLAALHREPKDLIEGVKLVPAGLAEIVERQVAGWVYVRP